MRPEFYAARTLHDQFSLFFGFTAVPGPGSVQHTRSRRPSAYTVRGLKLLLLTRLNTGRSLQTGVETRAFRSLVLLLGCVARASLCQNPVPLAHVFSLAQGTDRGGDLCISSVACSDGPCDRGLEQWRRSCLRPTRTDQALRIPAAAPALSSACSSRFLVCRTRRCAVLKMTSPPVAHCRPGGPWRRV